MSHISLTAFALTLTLHRLARHRKWSALVPSEEAAFYGRCVQACARHDGRFRLLTLLPPSFFLWLIEKMMVFGFVPHLALRKLQIAEWAQAELASSAQQLAVIGAGFDMLAQRLARAYPEKQFFELDMPATQAIKREAAAEGGIPPNLHYIPCDLSKQSVDEALRGHAAFNVARPTLFVAEGLTMYLTEAQNRAWLEAAVRACANKASVIVTALDALPNASPPPRAWQRICGALLKKSGETFRWRAAPDAFRELLRVCGYELLQSRSYDGLQASFRNAAECEKLKHQAGENLYLAVAGGGA